MSYNKCNTVQTSPAVQDPTEVINKYGADALRLYLIDTCYIKM
jgi:isoleucyl-tRNA synthetase